MIQIKLVNISKTNTEIDSWGLKTNQSTKTYKTIWAKQLETTIKEHYQISRLGKYTKTSQFLINKFEFNNEEKLEIDNKELDIIRVKVSYKDPSKLLVVAAE